jgi:hypothetical protein
LSNERLRIWLAVQFIHPSQRLGGLGDALLVIIGCPGCFSACLHPLDFHSGVFGGGWQARYFVLEFLKLDGAKIIVCGENGRGQHCSANEHSSKNGTFHEYLLAWKVSGLSDDIIGSTEIIERHIRGA